MDLSLVSDHVSCLEEVGEPGIGPKMLTGHSSHLYMLVSCGDFLAKDRWKTFYPIEVDRVKLGCGLSPRPGVSAGGQRKQH